MPGIKIILPCITLLGMLIFGLGFTVLGDAYIQRVHRRALLIIAALDIVHLLKDFAGWYFNDAMQIFPRTVNSILGYSIRPIIIILFFYLACPKGKHLPAWALAVVNIGINMTALFSKVCFWIDESNSFHRGALGYSCHVISGVLLGYLLYLTFREFGGIRNWIDTIPIFNTLVIIASVLLDMTVLRSEYPVTFLTVAIVCDSVFYYLWMHLRFVRKHENALMAEQRIQIMMTQIQPHFLYNTISTIQVLCTQRPDEAADITGKFGKYLRQNLESLGQTGMIPFGKELEHTRLYTDIEMVRFESITVEYEIGDRNFEIPSLTLQPMVENAIRHGVRGCEKGIVRVVTRLKDGYHEIIIQDNGCGFDPEKIKEDEAPHIGIRNVRERLQSMCGGTLTIDSIIGEGTTVTLAIPTENIENNQKHHQ